MKLTDFKRHMCSLALISLAVIAASGSANAVNPTRFIEGNSAEPYGAAPCMLIYYGAMYNTCPYNISVIYPLPYDTPGAKTITVMAEAQSSSANVGCSATATDKTISSISQTPWTYVGVFGSAQPITLPIPTGWTNGTMYMQCDIGAYGMVITASYTP